MADRKKGAGEKFVDWLGDSVLRKPTQAEIAAASAPAAATPAAPAVPKETRPTIEQVRGGGASMKAAGDVDNYRKGGQVKKADWREKLITGKKKTRIAKMASGGKVKPKGVGCATRGHGKGKMV